jgi:hypothetical protein
MAKRKFHGLITVTVILVQYAISFHFSKFISSDFLFFLLLLLVFPSKNSALIKLIFFLKKKETKELSFALIVKTVTI